MLVGLVAGDEGGLLPVHMPLKEVALPDHHLQFPANEFDTFSHSTGQFFQDAVGILTQYFAVGFKPVDPLYITGTAANQQTTARKTYQGQHHRDSQRIGTYRQGVDYQT